MLVGAIGGAFLMFVLFILVCFVVGALKEKNERGSPQKPLCVLHVHEHKPQVLWHRGQVFHDHEHNHNHEHIDGEESWEVTDDDGDDDFTPSVESVEQACNECEEESASDNTASPRRLQGNDRDARILKNARTGPLPAMRLATQEEAVTSAKIPEPSANGKPASYTWGKGDPLRGGPFTGPNARNVEQHERIHNADPSIFPSEEAMLAADRADMAKRGSREVCLAEQSSEQVLLPFTGAGAGI